MTLFILFPELQIIYLPKPSVWDVATSLMHTHLFFSIFHRQFNNWRGLMILNCANYTWRSQKCAQFYVRQVLNLISMYWDGNKFPVYHRFLFQFYTMEPGNTFNWLYSHLNKFMCYHDGKIIKAFMLVLSISRTNFPLSPLSSLIPDLDHFTPPFYHHKNILNIIKLYGNRWRIFIFYYLCK